MSYANYHDMDQQLAAANDPLASWQSHAPSVQDDGYAELGTAAPPSLIGDPPEPHRYALPLPGVDDSPTEPRALSPIDKPNYLCLHPGCELGFDNGLALQRHMTAHFDQSEFPAAGATAHQPSIEKGGVTHPLLASGCLALGWNSWGYSREALECPVRDCAFTESFRRYLEKHRQTHFLRGDKYMCQFEGCGRGFKRFGDLKRHEKTHLPDTYKHDCPEIGCEYKGRKGFVRDDKLMDHRRNRHGYPAAPRAYRRRRGAAQTSAVVTTAAAMASTVAPSVAGST